MTRFQLAAVHALPMRVLGGAVALVLVALALTSCGAGNDSDLVGQVNIGSPAEPAAAEGVRQGQSEAASAPAESGGHAYGSSIEEWVVEEADDEDAIILLDGMRAEYAEIEWEDLIPEGSSSEDLRAQFKDELASVEFGTEEAEALYKRMQDAYDPAAVNAGLAGQQIRLAGFVAPLTYDDDIVTEFLLVPSFGACIHVPPPPPNQTIVVSLPKSDGMTLEDTWGAIWVEGDLVVDSAETDLASASYKISNATFGVYQSS